VGNSVDQVTCESQTRRIAITGMTIRCPGAKNVTEFWSNLKNGVESISFYTEEELLKAGVSESVLRLPTFVRASAPLEGLELFDAEFFNYSAREAEFIDPQQRIFLECAVEALEIAGVDPARYSGTIGVFAGEGQTLYGYQILANRTVVGIERQMAVIGNDKDYLATRTSYKLGLRGPSVTVQCACSTSTVALHLAIQSLLSHECDVALAGGVSVSWLRKKGGYHFVEGGILSRDGHTRAFDANASGTLFADGAAIVVLKRLNDAVVAGDDIQAVILGTGVNNDGSDKISYTAPSVEGQTAVLAEAMAVAGISPSSIGYVEAHGTGTALGDPIEIEALQRVFRAETSKKQFCAVGSLKSNVGHLNTISGLAGTIKAALCVSTGEIPPSLHFNKPNPKLDFANSPFYVPNQLTKWSLAGPRRACISAFGIGGTNTEVIVEEPPQRASDASRHSLHLAIISAKTENALDAASQRLAQHLRNDPRECIADICYTLAIGRAHYPHARAIISDSTQGAAEAIESDDPRATVSGLRSVVGKPVAFLFPGQGSQHVYMGRELYNEEPVFRCELDKCAELLRRHSDIDLHALLFPAENAAEEAEKLLRNTQNAQPAIFSVSYALAKLWMNFGVRPAVAIGHSIGEFVAACIAGVFSLDNALRVVAERGRLIQSMPPGAMLAVMCPVQDLEALLRPTLSIGAINMPAGCVASGPQDDIAGLEHQLMEKGISYTRLHTSHAFHSAMMEPTISPFVEFMQGIERKPPQIPFISNVTGDWITDEQAMDPNYWGRQVRAPVLFHKGLSCIVGRILPIFLEVGPGRALSTLARSQVSDAPVCSSLGHPSARGVGEVKAFLRTAAELWLAGAPIDWSRRYEGERRLKRPLPTYPFERKKYWVLDQDQAPPVQSETEERSGRAVSIAQPAQVLSHYAMETATWKRVQYARLTDKDRNEAEVVWLVFVTEEMVDESFAGALRGRGDKVTVVKKGSVFAKLREDLFSCDPNQEADIDELCSVTVGELNPEQNLRVVYFCSRSHPCSAQAVSLDYRREVDDKINAPVALIRSLTRHANAEKIDLTIVTRDGQEVIGTELINPMMALPIGPCLASMHEYPGLNCRIVDITSQEIAIEEVAQQLAADLAEPRQSAVIAYRGSTRWARTIDSIPTFLIKNVDSAFRKNGVYLITGGLGALGLAVSRHLAERYQARLILISRTPLPAREKWASFQARSQKQKRIARTIQEIQKIEAAGGRVMVGAADVCDLTPIKELVRDAQKKLGDINGVIHAAGVPGNTPIGLKTPEEVDEVLRPKIMGLAVLEQVFADAKLDFLALFSSTSALWGRVGQVDYTAANAYLDSYAIRHWGKSKWPTISINWDNWREVGMAVDTLRVRPGNEPRQLKIGLSTADGIRAFSQALVARQPQLIVRAGRSQVTSAEGVRGPELKQKPKAKGYPRPALAQPYEAPATEREKYLSTLWAELLMITPIGRNDNFFELGGHSLLGLQLLPRIRDKYKVALEPRELFGSPTIAKLAANIEEKLTLTTAEA
jgi:acyl transferase domain-containing protein